MGSIYVKSYFKEEAKMSMEELVKYLRAEFDNILKNVDWMDEKTRKRALEKANAIKPRIGYPDELLVDQNLIDYYNGV